MSQTHALREINVLMIRLEVSCLGVGQLFLGSSMIDAQPVDSVTRGNKLFSYRLQRRGMHVRRSVLSDEGEERCF